ncbi:MAG: 2,3-bisphosphoglycerate-independent phosphoglycerate mutase, partial [Elusimicrobiaceae bacterium]|nr:2,3-bisphosphoglycerate-independent phosphoglycerate mutase [Elusimicrobiaceae bacterium]
MMKKVVLIIRDGWGNAKAGPYNGVTSAKTPNMDKYLAKWPHTEIEASGEQVGLPAGYMGSSEVGHLNMGAGRIVVQELKRLKDTIEDGSLFKSKPFAAAIDNCLQNKKALHVMGLVQDEGVHAHQDHLFAILKYAAQKGIKQIYVHFFSDGRDTPPKSAVGFIRQTEEVIKQCGAGQIATIQGRYYAMDRGEDWDLTDKAYNLIVHAQGAHAANAEEAVTTDYETLKTPDGGPMVDEYIPPTVLGDYKGMAEGDSVIFFNFRQDRAIQLTRAFIDDNYPGKDRGARVPCVFCGLTKYYDSFAYNALPSMTDGGGMNNLLGEVISKAGLKQLRLAETQKFKHVTSFFNGKLLKPYPGEDRIEKKGRFDPATFADHPEMEAYIVKDEAINQINSGKYDFIVINFANCDMVGHTGNLKSVVKAVEVVDE